jgi:hypothetical protein
MSLFKRKRNPSACVVRPWSDDVVFEFNHNGRTLTGSKPELIVPEIFNDSIIAACFCPEPPESPQFSALRIFPSRVRINGSWYYKRVGSE